MKLEKFDFYDPTSLKIYNLDKTMSYQLSVLDKLDPVTNIHCKNVGNLTGRICEYLGLDKNYTVHATVCGYLHDIGKASIPIEIIRKPTKLTDEEFEIMKTHTTIGYQMCMDDLFLRPYADGPLYHHEALDGTGYPQGLTKKDIPLVAQIIRIADEYDALTSKRYYDTHINISETLKKLIKESTPEDLSKTFALDELSRKSQTGKVNPDILKALFKVVINDILYEISCTIEYIKYLQDNVKRLQTIENYNNKLKSAKKQHKIDYYKEGMQLLFQAGENESNYSQVLSEYKAALDLREKRIDDLYNEIKIIKKLKV